MTPLLIAATGGFLFYVFALSSWSDVWKLGAVLGYVICILMFVIAHYVRKVTLLQRSLVMSGRGDEHTFAEIYQNSPVPYLRTDAKGIILHVNAAGRRLFGEVVEELVGYPLFDLLHETQEEAQKQVVTLRQKFASKQFVNEVQVEMPFLGDETKWALLSAFPYAHNKERLVTIIDITEQKKVDKAKTEFVSLASHQLRTPISSMLWNLELLATKSDELTAAQHEYITKVERGVRKMNALVNEFLDATKLEMGTFATKEASFALNAFLYNITEEYDALVAQKSLQLDVEGLVDEVQIYTDEHLLHMIVSNLISNAVKYTPEKGKVTVRVEHIGPHIQFTVRDTGIGVPVEDQSSLFKKLYRASNTKTSDTEGTGLGLYVVKEAVDILGGEISFTSEPMQGTEFVVTIPYRN